MTANTPAIRADRLAGKLPDTLPTFPAARQGWQPKRKNVWASSGQTKLRRPWQVGMLTAPRPRPTIGRALDSLAAAGWTELLVFADGGAEHVPRREGLTLVQRPQPIGSFCSWWLALWEMWLRDPHAARYLLVEDDVIFCRHVREYLESIELPEAGVISLYAAAGREAPQPGFHPVRRDLGGVGALAYLWTNGQLRRLLNDSDQVAEHRVGKGKLNGIKAQDTAVHRWCALNNLDESLHTPSLCQHIGEGNSALGHGPLAKRRSATFPGEDFDARMMASWTRSPTPSRPRLRRQTPAPLPPDGQPRIGLVGFNTDSGLGQLNRAIADHLPIDRWLVKAHSQFPTLPPHELVETVACPWKCPNTRAKIQRFLRGLHAVLFCEHPLFDELLPMCRSAGVRTVCVPMLEWHPEQGWPALVDALLCPTRDCFDWLRGEAPRARYVPWPIDADRFVFQQRTTARRFAFYEGSGGKSDRKGGHIVAQAARLAPEVPLVVYTQTRSMRAKGYERPDWPAHVQIRPATIDAVDLYRGDIDVAVCPSRYEGLGLQLLEAMASGMPLITTDSPPMNELPALELIGGRRYQQRWQRTVVACEADALALAQALRRWHGVDIGQASREARNYIERERSWQSRQPQIESLLLEAASTR